MPPDADPLGTPRLHLRETDSTNARAVALAGAGATHGTLVSSSSQSAGRGRSGRTWCAPPGHALLFSLVLRELPRLLPLSAALAITDIAGEEARIKWPNDVLVDGRKIAGILVEGRPQENWAVLGIGVNVAVRVTDLPPELHGIAGTLGRPPSELEPTLSSLLTALALRLGQPEQITLDEFRRRDALAGREIEWAEGAGVADGIDGDGRLIVRTAGGKRLTLGSGEVHLGALLGG